MKLLITTDFRAFRVNEKIYLETQHYHIIKRYKEAFGDIILCSRVVDTTDVAGKYDVSDLLFAYEGCVGFKDIVSSSFQKKLVERIKQSDLVVGRFHGIISLVGARLAKKYKKPFFAEVMGDTWDAYWNHGTTGKIVAPFLFFNTRKALKNADYALYVTQEFLQKRYPCKNESVGVSNVLIENIDDSIFEKRMAHIQKMNKRQITLMTTAAVDVRFKGQEYVIHAIPRLNEQGIRVRYMLVGGGKSDFLRGVAKKCGVEDQVEFLGRQPLNKVFELLDETDIYIQPSLQEGLPRSVIEAMSRGCPCIGAKTAGIPELIASECVVRRKSAKDIANAVLMILEQDTMKSLASQNFATAKEYLDEVLKNRRNAYFEKIKQEIAR